LISDKVLLQLGSGKDDKGGNGKNGKKFPGAIQDQDKDKQDMIFKLPRKVITRPSSLVKTKTDLG
jgi:hypothetical protein